MNTPTQFKKIVTFLLVCAIALSANGQTTITSTQAGQWTTPATWGGTAPGTGSLINNVSIGHNVTLSNDVSLSGSNSLTITITSGGTLNITSTNFTLSGNSSSKTLTIIVQSGGKLNYTGTGTMTYTSYGYLTVASGGVVTASSGAASFSANGFLTVQNGATSVSFGAITISGGNSSVTINSGGSASGTSLTIANSGSPSLSNAGTLTLSGTFDSNGVATNAGTLSAGGNFIVENVGGASLTNSGTINVTGNFDTYKGISNTGTMNITGDFTRENTGGTLTSSGNITVNGNAYANGNIQLNPGASANSETIIKGSLTIINGENVSVGTGSTCASSTYYADLVVGTNLILSGSGDIKVYTNGRLVVFGNIDGTSSSGTLVTANCGAQVYVNGNINLGTGGGNTVTNSNSASSPTGSNGSPIIGLYVNGTITAQTTNGTIGTKSQLQSNDLNFYNYISGLAGSPLPITLSFFGVEKINEVSIVLKWVTSSEINFDHFEIQKSTDGLSFYKIGEVKGNGTTSQAHEYQFEDSNPIIGKNFYRLKSIDFDGYSEVFYTVVATFESLRQISIYPNPLNGSNLHVDLNFETTGSTTIKITDLQGMEKVSWLATDSQNSMPVNLPSGIYLISVSNGTTRQVNRLIVN